MKEIRRTVRAAAMILALLIAGTALGGGTIDVPAIQENALWIDPIPPRTKTNSQPEIQIHTGEITRDGQTDSYWVTMPYDGRLRAEISELYSGKAVTLQIRDELGQVTVSDGYCVNREGVTALGLKAGDKYEIRVRQNNGYSSYKLTIGLPGETMDISDLTEVSDRISFIDQRNVYSFTVPRDGRYRFELFDMMKGFATELRVFNRLGEETAGDGYCGNREGVTLKNLKAGETYRVQVRQNSGTGEYRMLIGHQKETVDVSSLTLVSDSIEYTDQRNVYSFTVPRDGRYRFELYDMMNGFATELRVFNRLGEEIAGDGYCANREGVTLKNLKAGETYNVQVRQGSGTGKYRMLIGHQKEPVNVTAGTAVRDSVEYSDQRNVYLLEAERDGDVTIRAEGMMNGTALAVYVTNRLMESIGSDGYFVNGEQITVRNVSRGSRIRIEAIQNTGFGGYTLVIE